MPVPNPHIRFSYDDYQTLPEGTRYELLDGDLIKLTTPPIRHQCVLQNLFFVLHVIAAKLRPVKFSFLQLMLFWAETMSVKSFSRI